MTLLDDYRRAVYAASDDEHRRRLTPIGGVKPVRLSYGNHNRASDNIHGNPGSASHRKRLKPSRSSIRLETLSPSTSSITKGEHQVDNEGDSTRLLVPRKRAGNTKRKPFEAGATSNQTDGITGNASGSPQLLKTPFVLNRLAVLAAAAERQGGSRKFCTPTELPSQFIHASAHINISRWTTIVSDVTLHRIAARNRRIHNTLRQNLSRKGLLSRQSPHLDPFEQQDTNADDATTLTRSIIVNGAEQITDIGLKAIADSVPTLEALEIANAELVTDAGLRALAAGCPSLQRLNVSGCVNIKGAGVGAIAELCPRVRDLQLADCSQLGEWVLLRCFYSFTTCLKHLNLARCDQINDVVLKTLAHQCPKLLSIQLLECTQVSDVGVVQLAQKCSLLEKIVLSRTQKSEKLTDTSCAALGEHCPALREVHLAGCNFLTDAGVKWIADGCPQLEIVDLSNIFYLTDASMRALSNSCPKLKTLKIINVKNVSDVGLRFLATGCSQLETLHVSNLYLVSDGSNRDFGLEGLQAISKGCLSIKDLNLGGCFQVVERALVALGASCHNLTKINLKACPKITLLAVNALLHGCPSLVSLNLSGVLLCNNAMLAAIGSHGIALKELYVAQCDKIGDAGLRHLARRADQFEVLDFSGCSLISDAGISALVEAYQQPALTHLYLVGCSLITQDPIARLAFVCPMLLTLSVHGCRVSARVLQSLSSSWPFGKLRVPTGVGATQSNTEFGIFPVYRAKDKRFVEESCSLWAAAVKVQNLFRRRLARRDAQIQLEHARRVFVARRLQSIWRGRRARRETMLKRLLLSGLEKSAIKIQRQYRALRESRKVQTQLNAVFEQQTEKCAIFVQRKYRAKRAATLANAIMGALRRERKHEVAAATLLQRRYRGIAARKRFNLMQIQKQVQEREQREASLRIQAIYRGRMDRKKAKQAEREKKLGIQMQHACATKIQAHFRRWLANKEAQSRRDYLRFRESCAVKLQTAFRARRARASMDLMRLAQRHAACEHAAVFIQRHWRGRIDRLGFAVLAEAKKRRQERELNAAVHLQHTFRRYLIRKLARGVMEEMLRAKQRDDNMEIWAATLVQAHWRRIQALRELQRVQSEKRMRWKHLIDTYNQHGMGYGAPFFYNQINGEIRWRMPREVLMLQPRPACDQCETSSSGAVECATCSEFFCERCHEIVHGHGKRRAHETRKLFNYYGIRRDYGDGDFPSIWPSEIVQDRGCGYDFVTKTPKANYQDMLWQIAQFVPVEVDPLSKKPQLTDEPLKEAGNGGNTDENPSSETSTDADDSNHKAESGGSLNGVLFLEADFDDHGNSLWESFYDYSNKEYRYFHRISKRVTSLHPASPTET